MGTDPNPNTASATGPATMTRLRRAPLETRRRSRSRHCIPIYLSQPHAVTEMEGANLSVDTEAACIARSSLPDRANAESDCLALWQ